jgi:hypothetical protein
LSFYLEMILCDSSADYLEVTIDGTQVYFVDGGSAMCGNLGYVQQFVDIGAYADGGAHTLEFHSEIFANNGSGSNFFVDDVAIDVDAEPMACDVASDISWASVSPTSGTTAAAGAETVTVTFDSTGLAAGMYEGTLCVESNDPQNPLVEVGVKLTVEDNPTAVEMANLSAAVNADGTVSVSWVTAAEVGNAGFNVYRSVSADLIGDMLNSELIGSTASAGAGAAYSFVDASVGSGTYYYWVEAVSVDGATSAHGPVEAVTQAPTSAGLTGLGGDMTSTALPVALLAFGLVVLLGGWMALRRRTVRSE